MPEPRISDFFLTPSLLLLCVAGTFLLSGAHAADPPLEVFLEEYCIDCHDSESSRGDLNLELYDSGNLGADTEIWEKALRRLGARQMPPAKKKHRPSEKEYQAIVKALATNLDQIAEGKPQLAEVPALRRLTRTEYRNAIRDLLDVSVDVEELLPKDESSHGFDNITVGSLSSTLLNRYVSAAQKTSRVAVGASQGSAQVRVVRVPADRTQEEHVEGLPLGTRGGTLIEHTFPTTGEYEIEVRLTRDRNEEVEGLSGSNEVLMLVDRDEKARFTVKRPKNRRDHASVDAHLKKRIEIEGGTHNLGITFVAQSRSLLETKREPYDAQFNFHRHPRQSPAVFQVSISGPFAASPHNQSPSRRRLFVVEPKSESEEESSAKQILSTLARRAFRRPVTEADLEKPMKFFREGRKGGDFDSGIQAALSSILVSPQFLFRIERPPTDTKSGEIYPLSDVELASRLSFFLWSSLPDDRLLTLAEEGKLSDPEVLEKQVRLMLADQKSESLSTNFANQWLQLRNLEGMAPDLRMFPDFDDNLRQSFIRETELFFQNIVQQDRPLTELLDADYSFLNGRLATHYGIPHVVGSRFRRVNLDKSSKRGGLLRHGSVLMVTSYANRTSLVIRGNWILENVLGTPTPPPPPNTPSLDEAVVDVNLPMRERLAAHRADAACASCHNIMDPIGFSLENFDAVGRWREKEGAAILDVTGGLTDGQKFVGIDGLEQGLLARPELFARTVTEKLLTFALGRGLETSDAPAVRRIVKDAAANNYRFSDIVIGITKSEPFTKRKTP